MSILNFFNKKNIKFSKVNQNSINDNTDDWVDFKIYLDVSKEKIEYNLDWYSCYKSLTGICSLELESPIPKFIGKAGNCGAFNYCKNLAEAFKERGVLYPIYITKWENGVCRISDGQHRACICQHLNMKVPAYLSVHKSMASEYYKMKKLPY